MVTTANPPDNFPARELNDIDVSDPAIYQADAWREVFARLRREAPVNYCANSPNGPYWCLSGYDEIMQVELDHGTYSSASVMGGIRIDDQPPGEELPNFIRMDPPRHTAQRKTVAPSWRRLICAIWKI
ncbi:MAG: hypothetical protein VCE74_06990 [Alphaproteobacteria bacterium]